MLLLLGTSLLKDLFIDLNLLKKLYYVPYNVLGFSNEQDKFLPLLSFYSIRAKTDKS